VVQNGSTKARTNSRSSGPAREIIGVARLDFADTDRTAIARARWRPKGQTEFAEFGFEVPSYEVPPALAYVPPTKSAKKHAQMVRERPGQAAFRRDLKGAYGNRCCITGCTVAEALEGAHIDPYIAPKSNHVKNGLLLRRDVHALFDKDLVAIEPRTKVICVAKQVRGKSNYGWLHGAKLRKTGETSHSPDPAALQRRWQRFIKANGRVGV
jgi:hypothetical protein